MMANTTDAMADTMEHHIIAEYVKYGWDLLEYCFEDVQGLLEPTRIIPFQERANEWRGKGYLTRRAGVEYVASNQVLDQNLFLEPCICTVYR